jgi:uncharacterized protein (DUF1499 family)
MPSGEAWTAVVSVIHEWPRTTVVSEREYYLHVECRSKIFRFVDDLEIYLMPAAGSLALRSASRIGRSDLGVNRQRLEDLRDALRARGVVR